MVQIDLAPGTLAPTLQCLGFFSFKVDDYVPPPTRCLCCLDLATLPRKQPSATSALMITRTRTALNETNRSARPPCDVQQLSEEHFVQGNDYIKEWMLFSYSTCFARKDLQKSSSRTETQTTTRATGDQGNAQSTSSRPSGESNRQRSKMLRPPNAPALL